MMHLNEEKVQRIIDGELRDAGAEAALAHVASCQSCRERVESARRDDERVVELLRCVDTPAPALTVDSVIRAATRATPAPEPVALGATRRKFDLRWAAALLIAVAAAGAAGYVIPGSPLPGVVKRVLQVFTGPPSGTSARAGAAAFEAASSAGGIRAIPGTNFTVAFASSDRQGEAVVSLHDSAHIVIRALQGGASFSSPNDSLLSVENLGNVRASRFEISVPRSAPRVEILVAGRRVFFKEGDRITVAVSADRQGSYVIPLLPPPL